MIRLFTSGTHNGLTFTNADIEAIFIASTKDNGNIPFVIGHPKNDLPIVGRIPSNQLREYYEGKKRSIGFKRENAEFSEESIQVLKQLKKDKISVRLSYGVISHIGLVDNAAVKENNHQEFSFEDKTGVLCFSEDFSFENKDTDKVPSWFKTFSDKFFNNQKSDEMTDKEQELQKTIDALTKKVSDFENKDKETKENAELVALKAKVQEFENKDKEALKVELKAKVADLKLDATGAKEKEDFGTSLIDSNVDLAKKWIAELKPAQVASNVKQGSVTDKENEEFAAKDPAKLAEAEAKKQFDSLNTKA
jgi:hypothetical protein